MKVMKALLLGSVMAMTTLGSVYAQSAAELGKSLTPTGAIKAGNADGAIPAWDGGLRQAPAGYKPGTWEIDPFANEKPSLTITKDNASQYADKLSDGVKALLQKYPTYKLNVYPTHRTFSNPERIYQATIANATRAKLTDDKLGLVGTNEGIPFPILTEGVQATFNHRLRYRGLQIKRRVGQANPLADGSYTLIMLQESNLFNYNNSKSAPGNLFVYFRQDVISPARLAGEMLVVHDTINTIAEPRKAWTYNPGQRRVRLAPNVAYDNPGTASDGTRTVDNFDAFSGSPDRYDWKIVGKKEIYIPYNAYKLNAAGVAYNDIVKPGHINSDLTRWELHRVYVIEGNVKPTTSHAYAKRVMYIDEDSWQAALIDHYDRAGQLWRVGEYHGYQAYGHNLFTYTMEAVYDLKTGRYNALGLDNNEPAAQYGDDLGLTPALFTPDALRQSGQR